MGNQYAEYIVLLTCIYIYVDDTEFVFIRFLDLLKLPKSERLLCCTCGYLLLSSELPTHRQQGHVIESGVSKKDLYSPTLFLKPLQCNKSYAVLVVFKAVSFLHVYFMIFNSFLCLCRFSTR